MKIRLYNEGLTGDVPSRIIDCDEETFADFYKFVSKGVKGDFTKNVFVCFPTWPNVPPEKIRDEYGSILVSHYHWDIDGMMEYYLSCDEFKGGDFSVYEFDSYKDAFEFCILLQDGF